MTWGRRLGRTLVATASITVVLAMAACGTEPDFVPQSAEPVPSISMPEQAQGPFPVTRVVDGDTLRVLIQGQDTAVRLIGIDTPETVAPNRPVECAGPEASVYAEQLMAGQSVYLELDSSQGTYDRYDRVLAYVWLADRDVMVNLAMLQAGLAEEYTYDDVYAYQADFQRAERQAKDDLRGLWGQIC
jgi:micrococcal nuclease